MTSWLRLPFLVKAVADSSMDPLTTTPIQQYEYHPGRYIKSLTGNLRVQSVLVNFPYSPKSIQPFRNLQHTSYLIPESMASYLLVFFVGLTIARLSSPLEKDRLIRRFVRPAIL